MPHMLSVMLALSLAGGGPLGPRPQDSLQPLADRAPRFLLASSSRPVVIDAGSVPALRRRISVDVEGLTLEEALNTISRQAGLRVMYSKAVVPLTSRVAFRASNITVAAALTEILLDANVDILVSTDGQIVLTRRVLPLPVRPPADTVVAGTVVQAETGEPLQGAQVLVVGTHRGAVTDAAGRFRVSGLTGDSVLLRVRLIGYTPVERRVAVGRTDLRFELAIASVQLDEIVVTGTPGATQKRAIGNAVSTIKAAEVTEKAPIANVTELLQARTPGLTLMPGAGTVGTNANIRIRGAGSLNAGNRPVFYLDGVRIGSSSQSGFSTLGQFTSALDAIDPEDIESIEVIKGPAAATLYGADAAAGVIQIITKKGRRGEQSIQWSARVERGQSDWALEIPTNYTLCTPARIADRTRWPGCAGMDSLAPDRERVISQNPLREDPNALRHGTELTYGLNARGGGGNYSFYLGVDRQEQDGVFYNNYFKRTAGRGNFTMAPRDNLDVALSMSYTRTHTRLPQNDNASNGLIRNALRGIPGLQGPFAVGWRGLSPTEVNIYDNETAGERFIVGLTTNYQPWSWFRNRLTLGLDANIRLNTLFYPIDLTGKQPYGADNARGFIGQYKPETHDWTLDYAGTISTQLPHDLASDFSVGLQVNAHRFRSVQGNGLGLLSNNTRLVSSAAETEAFEEFEEVNSAGFFAQEQIGWKDRRYLTAAVRVDDNSAFGEDFSMVVYPKLSGSWVISEEPFFSIPWVNQLRLRAAFGQAGNSPAPFSADRTYEAVSVAFADGSVAPALRSDAYGNRNLKAETGQEIEVGFDASLFHNRAGIELTYYNKRTKDALVAVPVPPSSGFGGNQLQNIGTISNTGLELSLSGTPVQTPTITWDVNLVASTNHNKLVSFGTPRDPIIFGAFDNVQEHREGYPLAGYWGHEAKRNPDGTLLLDPQGRVVLEDTLRYIGPSTPTRELGLANTLTLWRHWRLYVFADYKGGHYMWNATDYIRNKNDQNAWAVVNPDADPQDVLYRKSGTTMPFITPADFVKLREVSLTYTVPTPVAHRLGVSGLSITGAGRNLAIWTKYSGADPELNFSGDATFNRTDYMSVPMLRRFSLSMNVTF